MHVCFGRGYAVLTAAVVLFAFARSSAALDQVVLKSGDTLRGEILSSEGEMLRLRHPELGEIVLAKVKIASFGPVVVTQAPPPAEAGEGVEPDSNVPATSAPATAGVALPPDESHANGEWRTHLALALAGNFALNDEITLRGSVGAKRETDQTKITLEAEYYYRVFNDEVTDNNVLVKGLEEWNLGESPWLFFVQGQYQYDEFQPWTHRISAYVGPGYRVIDDETMDLTIRLGVGATYENGDVNELEPEILLAEDFSWRISRRQELAVNVSIAPNVEDFADYRVQTQAEYRFLIDESKRGLSLVAGLRDIFLSAPAPDGRANELRVYAGLRYDF